MTADMAGTLRALHLGGGGGGFEECSSSSSSDDELESTLRLPEAMLLHVRPAAPSLQTCALQISGTHLGLCLLDAALRTATVQVDDDDSAAAVADAGDSTAADAALAPDAATVRVRSGHICI